MYKYKKKALHQTDLLHICLLTVFHTDMSYPTYTIYVYFLRGGIFFIHLFKNQLIRHRSDLVE